MSEEVFAASRIKLARARQFVEELECERARYKASSPITAEWNFEANPPAMKISWTGIGLLPGAIVGDAIHNLRTALDLMASELARMNGKSDKDVYFPFAASKAEFPEAIKRRCFDKAGADAVELLNTFAPYRGGNEALRAVHDLDIQDKHTALIPTGSTVQAHVEGSYDAEKMEGHGLKVVAADIRYRFPDGETFAGKDVVHTLEELVQLVDGIIEAFAALVAKRSAR